MTPPDYAPVGQRIRHFRHLLGLTQEQLGERAELHYTYVGQVERGDKVPSLKSLRKLATALHVPMDTLLEETEPYRTTGEGARTDNLIRELTKLLCNRSPEDVALVLELARTALRRIDNVRLRHP